MMPKSSARLQGSLGHAFPFVEFRDVLSTVVVPDCLSAVRCAEYCNLYRFSRFLYAFIGIEYRLRSIFYIPSEF